MSFSLIRIYSLGQKYMTSTNFENFTRDWNCCHLLKFQSNLMKFSAVIGANVYFNMLFIELRILWLWRYCFISEKREFWPTLIATTISQKVLNGSTSNFDRCKNTFQRSNTPIFSKILSQENEMNVIWADGSNFNHARNFQNWSMSYTFDQYCKF